MHRTRVASFVAAAFAAMSMTVLAAGAASADQPAPARSTETVASEAAACPVRTVPMQTNSATVPVFRHVGEPLPGGRMERTGEYYGGNFCARWRFTDARGVTYVSFASIPGWVRESDAHER